MSRYIDADALIKDLKRQYMFLFGTDELPNGIQSVIKNFPTADVVKVVRCKDCKDWQDDWIPSCGDNGSHYCATMDSVMKPTDYCSYGERRTE